jgi:hypothetical protein
MGLKTSTPNKLPKGERKGFGILNQVALREKKP